MLIASGSVAGSWPARSADSRYSSTSGTKRSGCPPMIAIVSGRPSVPGADDRLGRAADGDPHGQRVLDGPRVDALAVERRAMAAGPGDVHLLADRQQQLELLGVEVVVVAQVLAEERERLGERAAPGHDLRAAAGEQVDGRELLEDAHRVVGAEHRDGAGEADPLGDRRARAEHDGRRGDRVVGPVVLADREHVEPELVGERGSPRAARASAARAWCRGGRRRRSQGRVP